VRALALRWLSFLSVRFENTDELLHTLQVIVTTRDYDGILEDLLWASALRADPRSFERSFERRLDELSGHGSIARQMTLLVPPASGNSTGCVHQVGTDLDTSPRETLRFLTQFIERLELEDADIRTGHATATLVPLNDLGQPVSDGELGARYDRNATILQAAIQAIIQGVGGSASGRATDLPPVVYAGSIRLAPTEPLPVTGCRPCPPCAATARGTGDRAHVPTRPPGVHARRGHDPAVARRFPVPGVSTKYTSCRRLGGCLSPWAPALEHARKRRCRSRL
jgi:hypothetical protein